MRPTEAEAHAALENLADAIEALVWRIPMKHWREIAGPLQHAREVIHDLHLSEPAPPA